MSRLIRKLSPTFLLYEELNEKPRKGKSRSHCCIGCSPARAQGVHLTCCFYEGRPLSFIDLHATTDNEKKESEKSVCLILLQYPTISEGKRGPSSTLLDTVFTLTTIRHTKSKSPSNRGLWLTSRLRAHRPVSSELKSTHITRPPPQSSVSRRSHRHPQSTGLSTSLMTSHPMDCGVPLRRHTRQPRTRSAAQLRIIRGRESKRGAWPWQVSLQLLHPSFGLIGHWCGGVLVHPLWLLTAAHCIHNELFNLPIPALWTAVLGEWDRAEQRGAYVPIEKIVPHHRFHHYQHDIALMKMTKPADVSPGSRIRTICLPPFDPPVINFNTERSTTFYMRPSTSAEQIKKKPKPLKPKPDTAIKYLEKLNNLTKSVFSSFTNKRHKNLRYNIRVANDSNRVNDKRNNNDASNESNENNNSDIKYDSATLDIVVRLIRAKIAKDRNKDRAINDSDRNHKKLMFGEEIDPFIDDNNGLDFKEECYATGWGREQTNGTLTDVLLEADVPILPLQICRDRYSLSLPLNEGHLCAGSTDGSTGACVGDSGGPLQCRTGGRWELRGLTSFGSGCARRGVPDVYTNVAHYTAWIYTHLYTT
ncbi:Plasma kallikrein [Eumeta japonica]|uniref:Plasma kallikrein n=1 Tax=Eumeta variegata TaxID=151549 RepID=A0A4C1WND7_EUMVA|nr:Plasma kallikrein [Eumeta japonica]